MYRAIIDSVGWSERHPYTLEKGYGVQHEIILRVQPDGTVCKLLVFDLYSPEVFGDAHDEVAFLYAGRLPMNGKLWLDRLRGYRVEQRKP